MHELCTALERISTVFYWTSQYHHTKIDLALSLMIVAEKVTVMVEQIVEAAMVEEEM